MQIQPLAHEQLAHAVRLFLCVFTQPPWNEPWSASVVEQRLTDLINTPGFYGLATYQDAAMIGFILGQIEPWCQASHFYIKEMCVAPDWQRRGIGTQLLHQLAEDLAQRGVEKLYLLTARASSAEAFYRKCGFYISAKMVMLGMYLHDDSSRYSR